MKFTLNWLKDFLDTGKSLEEISECLTEIGLEVEEIIDQSKALKGFKSAEVLECSKHPDADKLSLCKVKTAEGEFQVVCGAGNVRQGLKVVYAPLNSVIPTNGLKIKKIKIRGVESSGMLCSAEELGIGEDSEGIIELPKNTKIGEEITDILGLNDPMIEIAITPNRGDCLGVYGIARDLTAAGLGKLKHPKITAPTAKITSKITANIKDKTACKALNLLELRNIKNCKSPDFIKQRLEAINISPKSLIVDVTNYLSFCYGQPLHAYDLDKIDGTKITAHFAKKNESFTDLNNQNHKLTEDSLVICDDKKAISLAGIIGSNNSGTDMGSKNILLEAANFDADIISKTGRKLQIESDSRYRFERKIDPEFTVKVLESAAEIIEKYCGGEASIVISANAEKFKAKEISLNLEKLEKIASFQIAEKEVTNIFENLGLKIISQNKQEIKVKIPSWRNDIELEEDLIEEYLRIARFSKIPLIPFKAIHKKEKNFLNVAKEISIKKLLAGLGLKEIISWSFISPEMAKNFKLAGKTKLLNPISAELSVMRESLLPNLVEIAKSEQNMGNNNIAIFEYGKIFKGKNIEDQTDSIAALRIGSRNVKQVNNNDSKYDIFDSKEDLLKLIEFLGLKELKLTYSKENLPPYYHPERSSALLLGNKLLAYLGEIHPKLQKQLAVKERINSFELFLENFPNTRSKKAKSFKPKDLQNLNRDFCFILDEETPSQEIRKEIFKANPELISDIFIFDLYQGDKIPKGKKSLAFNIILSPKDKTLTGEELENFNKNIIEKITKKFSACLP